MELLRMKIETDQIDKLIRWDASGKPYILVKRKPPHQDDSLKIYLAKKDVKEIERKIRNDDYETEGEYQAGRFVGFGIGI